MNGPSPARPATTGMRRKQPLSLRRAGTKVRGKLPFPARATTDCLRSRPCSDRSSWLGNDVLGFGRFLHYGGEMRRRSLMVLLGGGALSWPLVARAQQKAMPVIGWLSSASPGQIDAYLAAFRQGLAETGHVEGQNVSIEDRWAENHYDRLPSLERHRGQVGGIGELQNPRHNSGRGQWRTGGDRAGRADIPGHV